MTAFASLPLGGDEHRPIRAARTDGLREFARRTMHGGTGWVSGAADREQYQPQDQSVSGESASTGAAARLNTCSLEPEDARITGGTRSLMRRLSGLNLNAPKRRLAPNVTAA